MNLSAGILNREPKAANAGPAVEVRVVSDFSSGEIGRETWNSLAAASDAPVFMTYEWQSSWWKYFHDGRGLHILLVLIDGTVRGIAPLRSEKGNLPGTVSLAFITSGEAFSRSRGTFLDDGPADYLDVLVDPAFGPQVGAAMADHLARNRSTIERLDLVNLRPESAAAGFLIPAARKRGLRVAGSAGDVCPFVIVDGSVEDFIGGRTSGVRRRLNQAFRLLDDDAVRYRENDAEPLGPFMDDLVALHQRRWNAMGFPGLFFERRSADFQRTVAKLFSDNGWLWRSSVRDGQDRCIAARMGFMFRGRVYEYLSGFDESAPMAKKRPGLSLWLAMYRSAQASGAKVLDLLRGDEKYKFELTDTTVTLANYSITIGEGRTPALRLMARSRAGGRYVRFLAAREVRLFKVQAARHGRVRGVGTYLRFRVTRFARKRSAKESND